MIYLDSSAIVKLYVDEPDSWTVRAAVTNDPAVATVRISYAETAAALASAARLGRVVDQVAAMGRFQRDWMIWAHVELDQALVESAADLAARYALRGYDAVHLAAVLVTAAGDPGSIGFA